MVGVRYGTVLPWGRLLVGNLLVGNIGDPDWYGTVPYYPLVTYPGCWLPLYVVVWSRLVVILGYLWTGWGYLWKVWGYLVDRLTSGDRL